MSQTGLKKYLLCYFLHLLHVCCHGTFLAHLPKAAPGIPNKSIRKKKKKKQCQKNNRPGYGIVIEVNKILITALAVRPFIATHGVPKTRPRHRTRSTHGLLVQAIKTQHHLVGGPIGTWKTTQNIQSDISTGWLFYLYWVSSKPYKWQNYH